MPADRDCPFPGMDPFFEGQLWEDFHDSLIPAVREVLMDALPGGYFVVIERRPMAAAGPDAVGGVMSAGGATVTAVRPGLSLSALPALDEEEEIYVEVVEADTRRTVTAVEVLSPTNKAGDGRGEYLQKRNATLRTPVHLVEIDLLRGGRPLPTARPLPSTDYRVLVSRAEERPTLRVTSWNLPDPLPTVDVPLDGGASVPLDLAAVFAGLYRRSHYRRVLDYRAAPRPPLPDDRAAWVAGRLAAAGLP